MRAIPLLQGPGLSQSIRQGGRECWSCPGATAVLVCGKVAATVTREEEKEGTSMPRAMQVCHLITVPFSSLAATFSCFLMWFSFPFSHVLQLFHRHRWEGRSRGEGWQGWKGG